MGNVLTVVAGDVFVDPGESNLGGQSCHEANIHIVGVEGGLLCVLVPRIQSQVRGEARKTVSILHCVAQALPVSHVEGIHKERVDVGVSTNGYFKGISEVEAEENNETLGDHVGDG